MSPSYSELLQKPQPVKSNCGPFMLPAKSSKTQIASRGQFAKPNQPPSAEKWAAQFVQCAKPLKGLLHCTQSHCQPLILHTPIHAIYSRGYCTLSRVSCTEFRGFCTE